ncbi:hypothetical protein BaRGS_00030371 [Batillaria attramentaria]|uniref:Uncharacterized protein n=1 Tax=Batillaria attramentaria TaxID=370345 RepID=A0ABD0JUP9_9CAEN
MNVVSFLRLHLSGECFTNAFSATCSDDVILCSAELYFKQHFQKYRGHSKDPVHTQPLQLTVAYVKTSRLTICLSLSLPALQRGFSLTWETQLLPSRFVPLATESSEPNLFNIGNTATVLKFAVGS